MILLRIVGGRQHVYPIRSARRVCFFDSRGHMLAGEARPRAWTFRSGVHIGFAAIDETRIDAELRIRKLRGVK